MPKRVNAVTTFHEHSNGSKYQQSTRTKHLRKCFLASKKRPIVLMRSFLYSPFIIKTHAKSISAIDRYLERTVICLHSKTVITII